MALMSAGSSGNNAIGLVVTFFAYNLMGRLVVSHRDLADYWRFLLQVSESGAARRRDGTAGANELFAARNHQQVARRALFGLKRSWRHERYLEGAKRVALEKERRARVHNGAKRS